LISVSKTTGKIRRHLADFHAMSGDDLALFFEAWRCMLGWWFRQRAGWMPDTLVAVAPESFRESNCCQEVRIRACHLAVIRAERYQFVRGNCLLRSLTLQSMLQRRHLDADPGKDTLVSRVLHGSRRPG
jgi:hypothetical protein